MEGHLKEVQGKTNASVEEKMRKAKVCRGGGSRLLVAINIFHFRHGKGITCGASSLGISKKDTCPNQEQPLP